MRFPRSYSSTVSLSLWSLSEEWRQLSNLVSPRYDDNSWKIDHNYAYRKPKSNCSNLDNSGLEKSTRPLVFMSESSIRVSGNLPRLARQDE